jgi:hypothetical protein
MEKGLLAAEQLVEEAHRFSFVRGRRDEYPSIRERAQKMPDPASPKAYRI